ncbi:MATE family efflux transporter [Salidesulfovibrio onnuriiensis]|uniref:MATE family efflux transporter n=1 Tax=Salidesulfovibrio onnuriiensis TaxID=2583823 RepID=UPI00202AE312|nr:MATE family efflux transporter [Salidesulfovibrio onnuriiensis]
MVISMASHTIMMFTDRVFLGRYSIDALAAAFPASMTNFLFFSFFLGTLEYVGVFVAQYTGAIRHERVGAALWQGIFFCIPAALIMALLGLNAHGIFELVGHAPAIRQLEADYFSIVCLGSFFPLLSVVFSTFYSGRGITKPVMFVNMFAAAVNIPLDWMMINGYGPFPEMGIKGAALATVFAGTINALILGKMLFTAEHNRKYGILRNWRLDFDLLKRFLKFGLPGGAQFFLDMFAISFFGFMVGQFTRAELAATNIAISIDTLAFLPAVGMSIAASIMVGQSMGRGDLQGARYATNSVLHLVMVYMVAMAAVFIFAPGPLLGLFKTTGMSDAEFAPIMAMGAVFLRYVAAFTVLDALLNAYMGGLKGAGDTRFIMCVMGSLAVFVMILPMLLVFKYTDLGIHGPWLCLVAYVAIMAVIFVIRFRSGAWLRHRVIEEAH